MPEYLSPGVYVEEVPSGAQTITGVGTSTAGFVGIVKGFAVRDVPVDPVLPPNDSSGTKFALAHHKVVTSSGTCEVRLAGASFKTDPTNPTAATSNTPAPATVTLSQKPDKGVNVTASYIVDGFPVVDRKIGLGTGSLEEFPLRPELLKNSVAGSVQILVDGRPPGATIEILRRTDYPDVEERSVAERLGYVKNWLGSFAPDDVKFDSPWGKGRP